MILESQLVYPLQRVKLSLNLGQTKLENPDNHPILASSLGHKKEVLTFDRCSIPLKICKSRGS